MTLTDGAVGVATNILTSATGGFTAAMVGNALTLIQSASFKGHFWITGFTNANTITLDQNPQNLSSYTITIGGASTITNGGFVFIQGGSFAHAVAGNKIWVKGPGAALGDYQPSVNQPTLSVSGTATAPVTVEGYGVTRGDGLRPTIVNNAGALVALAVSGQFNLVKNLDLKNNSGTFAALAVSGTLNNFENCVMQGGTPLSISANDSVYHRCEFKNSNASASGISLGGNFACLFDQCSIHGNGQHGVDLGTAGGHRFQFCSVYANTLDGVNQPAGQGFGITITNCNLWNNGRDNIRLSSTSANGIFRDVAIYRNILGKAVGYDLNYTVSDVSASLPMAEWAAVGFDCNAFYTTGTGRYHFLPANSGDLVLTASPFVSDTDFTLNNTAGGGALIRETPCISLLPDGNSVYSYIGASAPQTAASTTELDEMRSLWRLLTNELDTDVVPNTEVDIWIHQGLQALNEATSYYVLTSSSLVTLVAEQQEYTLDSTVLNVEWMEWNGKEISKTSVDKVRAKERDWRNVAAGFPEQYAHEADKLIFIPRPSAAAVAASALPTLRYVARPPSPTTDGFPQLNRQAQRIGVFHGAALYSICYPDSAAAQGRAAGLSNFFTEGVKSLSAVVAQRGVSR